MNPIKGSATDATLKTFLHANAFLGETDRFKRLDRLEAYYRGLQHDHKTYDWDGNNIGVSPMFAGSIAAMAPIMPGYIQIRFRRPDVKFPLNRQVVRRFTDLLFSHTRKPQFEVEDDADTEDYLSTLINASNFFRQIKRARNHGGSMGSACVIFYFQNGRPVFRAVNPKYCTPTWADEDARELKAVKIEYKIPREEFQKESGKPKTVWYVYRRVITDMSDTIWPLTPINEQRGLAEFDDEAAKTVVHGYGFCPAEWVYNIEDDDNDYDGAPDCDGTYDLMDAIDILWSQANKGAKSNIDPTLILKVDKMLARTGVVRKGSGHPISVGEGGDAKYLELEGGSIRTAVELAHEFRDAVLTTVQCMLMDPAAISGAAASAKAIEYLYQPMLSKADDYRGTYGDLCQRLLTKVLKAIRLINGKTVELRQPDGEIVKVKMVVKIPPRIEREVVDGEVKETVVEREVGQGEDIVVTWGPYFPPTESDIQQATTTVSTGLTAGAISKRTGVKYLCQYFGVKDVEAEIAQIEAESKKASSERARLFGMDGTEDEETKGKSKIPPLPGEGEDEEEGEGKEVEGEG